MKPPPLAALALLIALPGRLTADPGSVPMNPLAPIALHGHTNVFLLQNRQIEAVLFPDLGRVARLGFRGEENLLRFDENLAETPIGAGPAGWRNYGGDWLWPVSQAHWAEHFGANWPPPAYMDGAPWTARGWINDDQSQCVLMELQIDEPLHIRVQRKFMLEPDSSTITVRQRIERTAESPIPVSLWNISQIRKAERIAMAIETNSTFVGGYRVLDFTPPPPELMYTNDPGMLVADVREAPELKIGSDSPRGWIAAQRAGMLVIEKALGDPDARQFPDGGCRTELYSNSGLGYSEIETLGEEVSLLPGESVENVLSIALLRIDPNLDLSAFAARVREAVGEPIASSAATE